MHKQAIYNFFVLAACSILFMHVIRKGGESHSLCMHSIRGSVAQGHLEIMIFNKPEMYAEQGVVV